MKSKNNISITWPDKKDFEPMQKNFNVKTDFVYPYPLAEKTLFVPEIKEHSNNYNSMNKYFHGDNLNVMQLLLTRGCENSIDLIYIDPPYMSSSNYHAKKIIGRQGSKQIVSHIAFEDTWNYNSENYLSHIYPRLKTMRRLLKENGSIFVHLDWHISHYVKLLLDEIFSPDAFINEIIWCYSGGSGAGRHFQRKHDVILWYVKGPDYIFNPQYRPYTEGTMQRGLTQVKGNKYKLNERGANLQDWWSDINKILSPTAHENLKFPTQKPLSLIKRIIATASNPGCLVADFYAGSGTVAEACEQMDRQWICCDSSKLAVDTLLRRMILNKGRPFTCEMLNIDPTESNSLLEIEAYPVQNIGNELEIMIIIKNYIPAEVSDLYNCSWAELINFWEIDLNYNGKSFNSVVQILRKSKKFDDSICQDIILRVPSQDIMKIAVRVHDLWGNMTTKEVYITGNPV